MVGERGVGKTHIVRSFARLLGYGVHTVFCFKEMSARELLTRRSMDLSCFARCQDGVITMMSQGRRDNGAETMAPSQRRRANGARARRPQVERSHNVRTGSWRRPKGAQHNTVVRAAAPTNGRRPAAATNTVRVRRTGLAAAAPANREAMILTRRGTH